MAMDFINPYNFISLPDKKAKAYEDTDRHTGVISYSITTKTPLFIPNTTCKHAFPSFSSTEQGKDHESYDFFSYTMLSEGENYEGKYYKPVIPGSELRGLFRNIYETLTDSCMGVLNEEKVPVKRTTERFQPGLIEKTENGYILIKAEECIWYRSFVDKKAVSYSEGENLYFKKEKRFNVGKDKVKRPITPVTYEVHKIKMTGDESGYLICGESDSTIKRKKHCHLFIVPNRINIVKKLTKAYIEASLNGTYDKKLYQKYKKGLSHFLMTDYQKENPPRFPVYYSLVGDYLYLSPACITKERAHSTIGQHVGEFIPCESPGNCCPACNLFGMVGKNNEEASASKIMVTDAVLEKVPENLGDLYDKLTTLQPLGEPKFANSEFYLIPPSNAKFWTYDYYIANDENVCCRDAKIRGRKYYWHHPKDNLSSYAIRTDQNRTIRPLKVGISFIGKLYFDGISNKQLKQLLWILNTGVQGDTIDKGEIAYKLGMGKPLGLGSISCQVTNLEMRTVTRGDDIINYNVENVNVSKLMDDLNYESAEFSSYVKKEFLVICSMEALKDKNKPIVYPITDKQQKDIQKGMSEGFNWFTDNHKKPGADKVRPQYRRVKDMYIKERLPFIEEEL